LFLLFLIFDTITTNSLSRREAEKEKQLRIQNQENKDKNE
jgi:hypothetical protein